MAGKNLLRALVPPPARRWLRAQSLHLGRLGRRIRRRGNIGSLRRTSPVSAAWGWDRGQPIDRYYIENFLAKHAEDVRGRVLEFADDSYARQFGGPKVTKIDILDRLPGNEKATVVADLGQGEQIPSNTFECIICTQVLQYVYDLRAAVRTLYRILKPGGVLLLTAPCIQKIDRAGMEQWGEYWRFTDVALRRLLEEVFPKDLLNVRSHGNVLPAAASLYGLAREDLLTPDLDYHDPDYPVLIALRAVKPRSESEA